MGVKYIVVGVLNVLTSAKGFHFIAFLDNPKLDSVPVDLCQVPDLLFIRTERCHADALHHVTECRVCQHGNMACKTSRIQPLRKQKHPILWHSEGH